VEAHQDVPDDLIIHPDEVGRNLSKRKIFTTAGEAMIDWGNKNRK
jgi:hypothetical protein